VHVRGQITDANTHEDVAGVTVSAVKARHNATTDVNGFFSLELRDEVKPGDDVTIHIEKEGYRADDLTAAASENVMHPIQISRLGKPPGKRTSEPTEHPKPAMADPETTGYLRTLPINARFDTPQYPTSVIVAFTTNNLGKQISPGATIFAFIRIRPEMTAKQEDAFFGTANLGGGPAAIETTENNYWEHNEAKTGDVKGDVEFSVDDRTGTPVIADSIGQMQRGETVIYFFVRHLFYDKRLGDLVTESCSYFQGPDFSVLHQCHGHNGPVEWPTFMKHSRQPTPAPTDSHPKPQPTQQGGCTQKDAASLKACGLHLTREMVEFLSMREKKTSAGSAQDVRRYELETLALFLKKFGPAAGELNDALETYCLQDDLLKEIADPMTKIYMSPEGMRRVAATINNLSSWLPREDDYVRMSTGGVADLAVARAQDMTDKVNRAVSRMQSGADGSPSATKSFFFNDFHGNDLETVRDLRGVVVRRSGTGCNNREMLWFKDFMSTLSDPGKANASVSTVSFYAPYLASLGHALQAKVGSSGSK
jgi:hypothetical protein